MALQNYAEQYDLDPETGQYTQKPAQAPVAQAPAASPFDASKVPGGVPVEWAQDFITRNPGDYHRLESAYQSGGPQQQAAPQYATPAQQWNAQPQVPQANNDLYKLLMDRIQQGTAVNRNDPNIRQQVDPVVAQQERASRSYLDDLAEKSGPLANLQGERRLASERSGQAAGALESEVIGREQAARRDEIQQALQLYGSMLTNDQRVALERELGYLQDAAHTADRAQNQSQFSASQSQANDQFMRELALREYDLGNTWDYRWSGLGA